MRINFGKGQLQSIRVLALACVVSSVGAGAQAPQHYKQMNLTASQASLAPMSDQHLVNPWGLSRSSGGPW